MIPRSNAETWAEATLSLENRQLHYYYSKSGTGHPLIFLHGAMDNGLCYSRLAEQFLGQYDIYLPDARGHGRSSDFPKNASFSDLVTDVKDLCEANSLRDVIIMGHSMGGAVAAQFAANYPDLVKAVVLEDPGFMSRSQKIILPLFGLFMIFILRHRDPPRHLSEFEKRSKKTNATWDPVDQMVWAKAQQEFTTHYPMKLISIVKGFPKGTDIIGKIKAPLLLITSEKGIVKKRLVEKIQAIQPALRWHYVAGAGHNIRREQFDVEIAAVKEFLNSTR
jgi:N-formylmaleamate deformylase